MGRHSKPTESLKKKIALGSTVALGSVVVPATFAAPASAATVDQWDRIAECESSGQWNRPDGDGGRSSGGLQFQPASWNDALAYLRSKGVDTSGYPQGSGHQAYKATKQQQIIAGEALLALQGPSAWTCNAMTGYPLGASMFKGGANPYPAADPTPTPPPSTPPPATPPPSAPADPDDADPGFVTVKAGDTLTKLAKAHSVEGGWKALYAANKEKVGSNPNLIHPGLVLALPGHEAPADDPYKDGLPKVGEKDPSAKALQTELKRVGLMGKGVPLADNYGPQTRAGVQRFHDAHPQFRDGTPDGDRQIGPKGWAHLRVMKDNASHGAPKAPDLPGAVPGDSHPSAGAYVAPVSGRVGQTLIVGSGGSMSRSAGGHSGLDITAPHGTPVKSVAAGTVVSKNASGAAYGFHVVVKHADGKYTLYAHLSATSVNVGQQVNAGTQVGNIGSTGNSSGPHLHFEVRTHPTAFTASVFIEPLGYLRANGVSI